MSSLFAFISRNHLQVRLLIYILFFWSQKHLRPPIILIHYVSTEILLYGEICQKISPNLSRLQLVSVTIETPICNAILSLHPSNYCVAPLH